MIIEQHDTGPTLLSEVSKLTVEELISRLNGDGARISADILRALDHANEKTAQLAHDMPTKAKAIQSELKKLGDQARTEFNTLKPRLERLSAQYVASPELSQAVEVAVILRRPLLVEGEAGTGKTSLAYAIAGEREMPIVEFQAKSTTEAQDLLYVIDYGQILSDAQLGKVKTTPSGNIDYRQYVTFGPIGRAFMSDVPVVLLIDEIDKASNDVPNDLLAAIEDLGFTIDETGDRIEAKHPPIVIVGSNHMKPMPDTFLRRCVYHYIEFPTPEHMSRIVRAKMPDVNDRLLQSTIQRFYQLRDDESLEKKPTTSELLDWVTILRSFGVADVDGELVYIETVLKSQKDLEKYKGNKSIDKRLKEYGMSVSYIAALKGYSVVRINDVSHRKQELYTLLANNHIHFKTSDNFREKVELLHPEVKALEHDWMIVPNQIFQLLFEKQFILNHIVVSDHNPIIFDRIITANELFVFGSCQIAGTSRNVYRMADGRVMYEV